MLAAAASSFAVLSRSGVAASPCGVSVSVATPFARTPSHGTDEDGDAEDGDEEEDGRPAAHPRAPPYASPTPCTRSHPPDSVVLPRELPRCHHTLAALSGVAGEPLTDRVTAASSGMASGIRTTADVPSSDAADTVASAHWSGEFARSWSCLPMSLLLAVMRAPVLQHTLALGVEDDDPMGPFAPLKPDPCTISDWPANTGVAIQLIHAPPEACSGSGSEPAMR